MQKIPRYERKKSRISHDSTLRKSSQALRRALQGASGSQAGLHSTLAPQPLELRQHRLTPVGRRHKRPFGRGARALHLLRRRAVGWGVRSHCKGEVCAGSAALLTLLLLLLAPREGRHVVVKDLRLRGRRERVRLGRCGRFGRFRRHYRRLRLRALLLLRADGGAVAQARQLRLQLLGVTRRGGARGGARAGGRGTALLKFEVPVPAGRHE